MQIKLINIGFGSIVNANRLIAIVSSESAPIKRKIQEARESGMLVDATYGRKTRAVLIADSGHVILSAIQPETVANRVIERDDEDEDDAEKDSEKGRERKEKDKEKEKDREKSAAAEKP